MSPIAIPRTEGILVSRVYAPASRITQSVADAKVHFPYRAKKTATLLGRPFSLASAGIEVPHWQDCRRRPLHWAMCRRLINRQAVTRNSLLGHEAALRHVSFDIHLPALLSRTAKPWSVRGGRPRNRPLERSLAFLVLSCLSIFITKSGALLMEESETKAVFPLLAKRSHSHR